MSEVKKIATREGYGNALVEYVAAKYEEYYAKLMNVIGEYRELDKDNSDDYLTEIEFPVRKK